MAEEPEQRPEQPDQQSWLRRWLSLGRQPRSGDIIAGQIGENARNIVVGKNVIQIGTLRVPRYLALAIAAGLALIAFSTAVLAWSASGAATRWGQPARMTGLFNIAVATFGEVNAAGQIKTTENGRRLSQWVYEALQTEYTKNDDLARLVNVQIWHGTPGLFGRTAEFDVLQGNDAPNQLAERVNAHLVIYGNINAQSTPPGLELKFFIAPQVRSEANSVIGSYIMGQPIPVMLPFDANNPVGNLATGDSLNTRAAALSLLTIGLTYELAGKYQKALDLFQQATTTLSKLEPGNGQEIPYFFMGREALFLGEEQTAEQAFQQALLASNQQSVRAQIGLGSVYLVRAQNLLVTPTLSLAQQQAAQAQLTQALTAYEQAVALAQQTGDPLMESIAQLAFASALRVQGQLYYQSNAYEAANQAYDQAIALLTSLTDSLAAGQQARFLAQAYQSLGAAYVQQADIYRLQNKMAARQQRLEQASTAFGDCIAQGKIAPFDEILRTKIIGAPQSGCQAQFAAVTQTLQASGSG